MGSAVRMRLLLSGIGGVGALALYLVIKAAERQWMDFRSGLALGVTVLVLTGGLLAMAGRMPLRKAGARALPLAALTGGLVALVALRWSDVGGFAETPWPALAALVVATLPVPMLMAEGIEGSWRDYPALFRHSWGVMVRGAVASTFAGVVWLVIWLCDMLLRTVGLTLIGDLIDVDAVPYVLTGAVFGLGVAVVIELADHISPRIILWLLRLLMPVVAGVSAVFAVSVLLWGFERGFDLLSPALTLLTMAMAGIGLITITLDEDDAAATQSGVLRLSARAMALLLPVLGGLAVRAIWLRVAPEGWTPNRLFLAVFALVVLTYGIVYAGTVLRGGGWRDRIRAANPWLALGVILTAVLWQTPLLNAERISANDQAARYIDGRKSPSQFSAYQFQSYGHAGVAAQDRIRAAALAAGDAELLAALEGRAGDADGGDDSYRDSLVPEVERLLPVQPASAAGMRLAILSQMQVWELEDIRGACLRPQDGGQPGCLLVVADLVPALPGEEAILALDMGGWIVFDGLYLDDGRIGRSTARSSSGATITEEEGRVLLRSWQAAPPATAPMPLNQLGTGQDGVYFLP